MALATPLIAQDAATAPFGIPGSDGELLPYLKRNAFTKQLPGISHDKFVRAVDGFAELWWKDWPSYQAAAAQRLREREEEARRRIALPSLPATLVFLKPYRML